MNDENDLAVRVSMLEVYLQGLEGRLDMLVQDAMERLVILEENLAQAEGRLDVLEERMRRVGHELSST